MSEHERSPIGDYIFERMPEADRETVRRFMAAAKGDDQDDLGYMELGNFGINVARAYCEVGHPVEDRHIRLQLECMAEARLLDETMDRVDWDYLTLIASSEDKRAAARVRSLFVLATGISDEDVFDEKLRAERRAREAARG
ncbi:MULTISPECIES: hypothetical protein [Methylobacterium]|jgi:hypothetical protein|uniref:Uncharacterized protein n=2 Tax=Methylobacterium TaxID=407 RepID=A0A0C6FFY7_9HYPH|nr:hypothetical protein [Methylobacterium aquaticum]QRE77201.1 hypothetical protein F1D61_29945 [Methylobacterium aquaticum]BAQ45932.1 hypothetical protein Maq22A_c13595 [Methylobacterium aquaticum]